MSSPRVLLVDIETFPNLGFVWGKYEQTVLDYVSEWELASFAYKEHGRRGGVTVIARPDFEDQTDGSLVAAVREVVDGADVLVGHHIDGFDAPMLRTKFVVAGQRPTHFKTVDTKKLAKRPFRFNSNKLDDLCKTLGIGGKVQTGGYDLWRRCMRGYLLPGKVDREAWKTMRTYNAHDVELLESAYDRLRPWDPQHPNFSLYSGEDTDRPRCPVCETAKVKRCGFVIRVVTRAARWQCLNPKCGKWFQTSLSRAAAYEALEAAKKKEGA